VDKNVDRLGFAAEGPPEAGRRISPSLTNSARGMIDPPTEESSQFALKMA